MNKRKVINDPVYGFITIGSELIYDLIQTPEFQRLRRIKQLGMTHLVYPGAVHTRFAHALGAYHLMQLALSSLRNKGVEISAEEWEASSVAILLHDIGHGPFSHALESTLIPDTPHELVSVALMKLLNERFNGALNLSLEIFHDRYPRKFLHQLVSSQLDLDRLDYLTRDSFFTGVSEGIVGWDRLIQMMDVHQEELVIQEKGLYSVEKFLVARRLMYWQVYLHKTAIAAETLSTLILKRAADLTKNGIKVPVIGPLAYFMEQSLRLEEETLSLFVQLDDDDVMIAIKQWQNHEDFILSDLCKSLLTRQLPVVHLSFQPFNTDYILNLQQSIKSKFGINVSDMQYYYQLSRLDNTTYKPQKGEIGILKRDGRIFDVEELSNQMNMGYLLQEEKKYCLYAPKKLAQLPKFAD